MSNIKNALTKKFGPFPAWVWAVIIGGAYYYYEKHKAASTTATTATTAAASTTTGDTTPTPLAPGQSLYVPGTGLVTAPGTYGGGSAGTTTPTQPYLGIGGGPLYTSPYATPNPNPTTSGSTNPPTSSVGGKPKGKRKPKAKAKAKGKVSRLPSLGKKRTRSTGGVPHALGLPGGSLGKRVKKTPIRPQAGTGATTLSSRFSGKGRAVGSTFGAAPIRKRSQRPTINTASPNTSGELKNNVRQRPMNPMVTSVVRQRPVAATKPAARPPATHAPKPSAPPTRTMRSVRKKG